MTLEPCGRFEWERALWACDLPRTTKLVALVLAGHANGDDGGNAHPGRRRLAAWCQLSERAIEQHLAALRDLGLIERTERGRGNRYYRRADCYRLTIPDDLHDRVKLIPDPGFLKANSQNPNGASPSSQNPNHGSPSSADSSESRDNSSRSRRENPEHSSPKPDKTPHDVQGSESLKANGESLKAKNGALEVEAAASTHQTRTTKQGSSPRMKKNSAPSERDRSGDRPREETYQEFEERHRAVMVRPGEELSDEDEDFVRGRITDDYVTAQLGGLDEHEQRTADGMRDNGAHPKAIVNTILKDRGESEADYRAAQSYLLGLGDLDRKAYMDMGNLHVSLHFPEAGHRFTVIYAARLAQKHKAAS